MLILDEATASVDSKTDLVITKLIHEEFKGSTILIIAHRLRVSGIECRLAAPELMPQTVMPCDKIIVMDRGRIDDFDTPWTLIDRGEGAFFDLCMAAGEEEFKQLRALTETVRSASSL